MIKIPISTNALPGNYWIKYVNEDRETKYIDLSGCACNFTLRTGYASSDNYRVVGWRYIENGYLCYELFNAGHTVFYRPIKPTFLQVVGYMLSGKKTEIAHKAFLAAFEDALNKGGWKTIEREDKKREVSEL